MENKENFLQKILELSPSLIYVCALSEGKYKTIYLNKTIREVVGFTAREKDGEEAPQLSSIINPDDIDTLLAGHKHLNTAPEGKQMEVEFRVRAQDGGWRWLKSNESVFARDASGNIKEILGVAQDITEQKTIQAKLKSSEKQFQTLIEKGNDGVLIVQGDGIVKYVNPILCQMSGYPLQEFVGKPFVSFLPQEYAKIVMERYRKRLSGQDVPNRYEIAFVRKDGSILDVELNSSLVEYDGVPAVMAIVRDIADQKKQKAELEKHLETINKLNQLLLGREVRMAELKNEIEELKRKLPNPA
ncbi:MAG TPA: PAS domain S-box protein [Candidatus Paceibacterota bacterium]|nr:PAS domain S-box protein [Candidatus Paceibacterota bacterium]